LKHAELLMALAKQIELAPKNGDFVVLQDGWSGSWEVGRWATESSGWVQIDGKPLRIFPTHWVPVSGDTVGLENTEGLPFLVPAIPVTEPPKQLRARFVLAFTVAAIFAGGFAAFKFGFTGAGPARFDKTVLSVAEPRREVSGEQDAADAIVRNLASARGEIALHFAREDDVQAEAVEAKRIADAKQKELKQALDESEARAEALAHELASVRASAGKAFNENVAAQDGASPTEPLNRSIQQSNAVSGMTGVVPNAQSLDEPTARTPTFSDARSAPTSAAPGDPVAEPSRPPARPRQSEPTSAISSADEARLIARAEFLIKQFDFSGARLLLEYALDKGSARAAFLMAETYDWRMLRSIRRHGVRGDSKKAQELYELAAVAGNEKARERLETLKSSGPPRRRIVWRKKGATIASRRAGSQEISNGSPNGGASSVLPQTVAAALYSGPFNGKATK
jgi:TPR repeat protein